MGNCWYLWKTLSRRLIRFGTFEADPAASELRKAGRLITVQDQPFRLLMLLLEHREVVTRDELRQKLWGETYVDFEEGLNTAVRKLGGMPSVTRRRILASSKHCRGGATDS